MKTQMRTLGLGLVVVTVVSLCGATSSFSQGLAPRIQPYVPPVVGSPVVPRLGILGHVEYGWGMVVDSVVPYTTANRLGLERGDVILSINGQQISNDWAYRQALVRAVRFENGQVNLQVADVRSGRRVFRRGFLNANPGVSRPWSAPYGSNPYGAEQFGHNHNHFGEEQFGSGQHYSAIARPVSNRSQSWVNEAW